MKQNNRKYIGLAAIPIMALALIGAGGASAQGPLSNGAGDYATNLQDKFQREAEVLGVSIDVIKEAWSQGKTLLQLAQDQGIDQTELQNKLKEARKTSMKDRLQTLVNQGIITQTQADQRYSFMEQHLDDAAPGRSMGRMMFGGWGRHGPRS